MSSIDDDHELEWILESTNINEYELIDLPMEEPDDLSHEHMGVRMAPTLDLGSTSGLAPCEGSLITDRQLHEA